MAKRGGICGVTTQTQRAWLGKDPRRWATPRSSAPDSTSTEETFGRRRLVDRGRRRGAPPLPNLSSFLIVESMAPGGEARKKDAGMEGSPGRRRREHHPKSGGLAHDRRPAGPSISTFLHPQPAKARLGPESTIPRALRVCTEKGFRRNWADRGVCYEGTAVGRWPSAKGISCFSLRGGPFGLPLRQPMWLALGGRRPGPRGWALRTRGGQLLPGRATRGCLTANPAGTAPYGKCRQPLRQVTHHPPPSENVSREKPAARRPPPMARLPVRGGQVEIDDGQIGRAEGSSHGQGGPT